MVTPSSARRATASTWAHRAMAAAISRPLAFTEPARNWVMGVTATSTPATARLGRTACWSALAAAARSTAQLRALTRRMR